jgi:hypothetical protein
LRSFVSSQPVRSGKLERSGQCVGLAARQEIRTPCVADQQVQPSRTTIEDLDHNRVGQTVEMENSLRSPRVSRNRTEIADCSQSPTRQFTCLARLRRAVPPTKDAPRDPGAVAAGQIGALVRARGSAVMEEQIIGAEGSRQGERPRIWGAPRLRCCRVHIFAAAFTFS